MTKNKETCVLCSRVELTRNLKHYPFPSLLSEELLDKLLHELRYIFDSPKIKAEYDLLWSNGKDLGNAQQMQLQLQNGFQHKKYEDAFYQMAEDPQKNLILFLGAGDHIQMKKSKWGLTLDVLWEEMSYLDDLIDASSEYAFDPDLGYLTSHVTDVGTGMHASVLMHLPALKESGLIDDINQAAGQLGLTVTGLSDQVLRGAGAFYRIKNHVTIGRSEWEMIDTVTEISRQIARKENEALETIYISNRLEVEDRISRAMGILSSAKLMGRGEFLDLISSVRMGIRLKLIQDRALSDIDALIFNTSAGTLQLESGKGLSALELKSRRADVCRRFFK